MTNLPQCLELFQVPGFRWSILCISSGTLCNWPLKIKKKQTLLPFWVDKEAFHKISHIQEGEKVISCRNLSSMDTEVNLREGQRGSGNHKEQYYKSLYILCKTCILCKTWGRENLLTWAGITSGSAGGIHTMAIAELLEKIRCSRPLSSHYSESLLSLKAGKERLHFEKVLHS